MPTRRNNENLWTEARMTPLLYNWNISINLLEYVFAIRC